MYLKHLSLFASAALIGSVASAQITFIDEDYLTAADVDADYTGSFTFLPGVDYDGAGGSVLAEGFSNQIAYDAVPVSGTPIDFSFYLGVDTTLLSNNAGGLEIQGARLLFGSNSSSNSGLGFNADYEIDTNEWTLFPRVGGDTNAASSLSFAPGSLVNGTYTFDTVADTGSVSFTIDGSTVSHSFTTLGGNFEADTVFVRPGENLILDGFTVTQVPEPSVYSALAGVVALGFVFARRRRS